MKSDGEERAIFIQKRSSSSRDNEQEEEATVISQKMKIPDSDCSPATDAVVFLSNCLSYNFIHCKNNLLSSTKPDFAIKKNESV